MSAREDYDENTGIGVDVDHSKRRAVVGHTPGPWEHRQRHVDTHNESGHVVEIHRYVRPVDREKGAIADVLEKLDDDERKANARLIAAAPELFWACLTRLRIIHERASDSARFILSATDDATPYLSTRDDVEEYTALRAAIRKARGEL